MQVNVTRHYASKQDMVPLCESTVDNETATHLRSQLKSILEESESVFEEWRVLRFNNSTVQSVARTIVGETNRGEVAVVQRADCMAFLYMQSIAAAGEYLILSS